MLKSRFTLLIFILALGPCTTKPGVAGAVSFFKDEIDYWGKAEAKKEAKIESSGAVAIESAVTLPPAAAISPPPTQAVNAAAFDWNKHLDPKNTEFFKEGDYTPPEAFMELVRNPSDENLRMWFAYVDRKNALAERLAHRMQEYSQKNALTLGDEAKAKIAGAVGQLPAPDESSQRFRFRMYFDSNCPHCKRMFETLNELQARGYFVEARQIDRGLVEHLRSEVAITPATKDEISRFRVDAVPLLLIGDLVAKAVYRQAGFATAGELLRQIQEKAK